MKKVPKMISTKDLAYLGDIFNWNITASKKLCFYSDQIEDKEIKKIFDEFYVMHEEHCYKIINILESGGK